MVAFWSGWATERECICRVAVYSGNLQVCGILPLPLSFFPFRIVPHTKAVEVWKLEQTSGFLLSFLQEMLDLNKARILIKIVQTQHLRLLSVKYFTIASLPHWDVRIVVRGRSSEKATSKSDETCPDFTMTLFLKQPWLQWNYFWLLTCRGKYLPGI